MSGLDDRRRAAHGSSGTGGALGVWTSSLRPILVCLAALSLVSCDRSAETYRDAYGTGACKTPRCAGHEAGWRWARGHHLDDPRRCHSHNPSFTDGCRAFASGG